MGLSLKVAVFFDIHCDHWHIAMNFWKKMGKFFPLQSWNEPNKHCKNTCSKLTKNHRDKFNPSITLHFSSLFNPVKPHHMPKKIIINLTTDDTRKKYENKKIKS